jgi:VIT1/CCC1 family predicted Fe2+/Mn2+ transporter
MNKTVSLAILAGGILLLIFGVSASESLSSPTDKAIWMLVGGVVATIIGLVGLLR